MILTAPLVVISTAIIFGLKSWTLVHPGEHVESPSAGLRDASQAVKDATYDAMDWTKDKTQDVAERAQEAVSWTKDKASDILTRVRQQLTGYPFLILMSTLEFVKVLPDDYIIFLDCPGLPIPSLHIHLTRNQLLVFGDHEECFSRGSRRACYERSVEEVFELPEDADQERVEAWGTLGVLVVRVPRKALPAEKVVKVAQRGTLDRILERVGLED